MPLHKLVYFRDLLEENAFRLTDRRHMSDLIPFILEEEQARIKNEIAGKAVSVIYDGTTRLGEALAIVLRYVGNDWTIQQRLVGLNLLAKSLTGKEIVCELVSVLSTTYGIGSDRLLAAMRDGASTNGHSYAYFGSCVGYNMLFPQMNAFVLQFLMISSLHGLPCFPIALRQSYAGSTKLAEPN